MAGLLDDVLGLIDRAKQSARSNVGLLMDNPQEYMRQINESARDINRQDTLAIQGKNAMLSGMQPNPEQIAAMQAMNQRAENLAMGFAGTVIKNPAPFKVAHGTNAQFDEFQRGMGITAKHIYTTPENFASDAALYGKNLIKAEASPKRMIDFSDYDKLDKITTNAIKKAAKDAGITDKYYSFETFLNDLMTGQMYQVGGGQRTQNAFLSELFSKYDAVKMPDASVSGGLSQSVVFENPSLLKIQK
jgi:hypothetical protein